MANTDLKKAMPLSPHIGQWRWHVTMATSIFHRFSGVGNYVGAILVTGWLLSIAMGANVYAGYAGFMGSIFGQLILFVFTLSITYHFLNGIRHLIWDAGKGYTPSTANLASWIIIGLTPVIAAGMWLAGGLVPGLGG